MPRHYDVKSAQHYYLPNLHTLGFDRIASLLYTLDPYRRRKYIVYTDGQQYIVYTSYQQYMCTLDPYRQRQYLCTLAANNTCVHWIPIGSANTCVN